MNLHVKFRRGLKLTHYSSTYKIVIQFNSATTFVVVEHETMPSLVGKEYPTSGLTMSQWLIYE